MFLQSHDVRPEARELLHAAQAWTWARLGERLLARLLFRNVYKFRTRAADRAYWRLMKAVRGFTDKRV